MPLSVRVTEKELVKLLTIAELMSHLREKGIKFHKPPYGDSFPQEPYHMYHDKPTGDLVVEQGT